MTHRPPNRTRRSKSDTPPSCSTFHATTPSQYLFITFVATFYFLLLLMLQNIIPSRALCIDRIHLSKSTNLIVKDEGEGLILRMPQSVYEHGRSTSLLKLKVSIICSHLFTPRFSPTPPSPFLCEFSILFQASRADKEALVTRVDADGVCQLQLYVSSSSFSFSFIFLSFVLFC